MLDVGGYYTINEVENETEKKFWEKIRVGTTIVTKSIGMFIFGFFLLFSLGLLPGVSFIFKFYDDFQKNTEFRKCWPVQKCDGIAALPIDDKQNKAIEKLYTEMGLVSDYIQIDCLAKIKDGNKKLDCKVLFKRDDLDL